MNRNFSPKVSEILAISRIEAARLYTSTINPEHLMLGILKCKDCTANRLLESLNVNLQRLHDELESVCFHTPELTDEIADEDIIIGEDTSYILQMGTEEAIQLDAETIDSEHLLLALMKEDNNNVRNILQNQQIAYDDIKSILDSGNHPEVIEDGYSQESENEEDEENEHPLQRHSPFAGTAIKKEQQTSQNDTPMLDRFGADLTKAAEDGCMDPVIGRTGEMERISQILSRRKKNNPILIGEPGVGKSAIVEGLAMRIVQKKVSRILYGKRVIALDMAALVSGTKYRGQFEERIHNLLQELKEHPEIILFIDEIHTIIGAGSTPGSMDAANILKPALARGEIQCIGATTTEEYRKSIEKDGALERRFQKVMINPTSASETLQILENIKERYEEHHQVTYTDDAIKACVNMTERYIADRCFPDKAIDALDEAGARVHIMNQPSHALCDELELRIETLKRQKNDAVKAQDFKLAAALRDEETQAEEQLQYYLDEMLKEQANHRPLIDENTIAETVSIMSGIPAHRINEEEMHRLLHLGTYLKQQVIGQDAAIDELSRTIQRARVGLKDPQKPIGTFMFLGPTGVGKTLLAKKLSEKMFGTSDALIRVDMSEYMEKHTVSRMVGAPPGYIGHDEGGQLTEKVRRRPYSIILLDEIEKAHPDVFNILLQVMDEGRLTDSNGVTIDFKNTIIIMTSNCGTRQLMEFGNGVGFGAHFHTISEAQNKRDLVMKQVKKQFSPEFLNRLDAVIHFDPLSEETIRKILDVELQPIISRIEKLGYEVTVSEDVKDLMVRKGYDKQYGARPVHRSLQMYLEAPVCEKLLELSNTDKKHLQVRLKDEEHVVVEAE